MASGLKGQKFPNLVLKFMKFPSKSNLAAFVYFIMWANKFEKFYDTDARTNDCILSCVLV